MTSSPTPNEWFDKMGRLYCLLIVLSPFGIVLGIALSATGVAVGSGILLPASIVGSAAMRRKQALRNARLRP